MRSEISEYFDFVSTVCRLTPCGVMHTVEIDSAVCCMHTTEIDSAVCCLPRRLTRRCAAHQGDWLAYHGELWDLCVLDVHTALIDSAVWCKLRNQNRGIWLSSVMHTTEMDSAVWYTLQRLTPRYDATLRRFLDIWMLVKIEKLFENT